MAVLTGANLVGAFLNGLKLRPLGLVGAPNTMVLNVICSFVPCVVLPVCSIVSGVSGSLLRTSRSLNSGTFGGFGEIVLPLDHPNVVSNVAVIFMPSIDAFCVSRGLNNGGAVLINSIVRCFFGTNPSCCGITSTVSVILVIVVLIYVMVVGHFSSSDRKIVM